MMILHRMFWFLFSPALMLCAETVSPNTNFTAFQGEIFIASESVGQYRSSMARA